MYGAALSVTVDGRSWWNFKILRNWRILIRAMCKPSAVAAG